MSTHEARARATAKRVRRLKRTAFTAFELNARRLEAKVRAMRRQKRAGKALRMVREAKAILHDVKEFAKIVGFDIDSRSDAHLVNPRLPMSAKSIARASLKMKADSTG